MVSRTRSRGLTLVELIVAIVVIAIAVSAVLALLSATAVRSADTMVRQQAALIGESYLREILGKPFGAADCVAPCQRSLMDTVIDYNGLVDSGVHDASGNMVPGLSGYDVNVAVANTGLGVGLKAVPVSESQLVTVRVTAPTGVQVVLSGYRTLWP